MAEEVLGWTPCTPLSEGLKKTIAYFEELLKEPATRKALLADNR